MLDQRYDSQQQELLAKIAGLEVRNRELLATVNRYENDIQDLNTSHEESSKLLADIKAKETLISKLRGVTTELLEEQTTNKQTIRDLHRQLNEAKQLIGTRDSTRHNSISTAGTSDISTQAPPQGERLNTRRKTLKKKSPPKLKLQESLISDGVEKTASKTDEQNNMDTELVKDTVEALVRKNETKLIRTRIEYEKDIQSRENAYRHQLDAQREEYSQRILRVQAQHAKTIQALEKHIQDLTERNGDETCELTKAKMHRKEDQLRDGILKMETPGAHTSIIVPSKAFERRDLMLHISFPPQTLTIMKSGNTFKLQSTDNQQEPVVSMINLKTLDDTILTHLNDTTSKT